MDKVKAKETALGGVRVLDLADFKGVYCTKLLAGLGADVIKVEPPGGDPTRNIGPFFHDEPHPEKSLYWFHFNINKRSITLNLNSTDGREIFRKLVGRSDILVESFSPGYLDELGLGYTTLKGLNPRLILTSITPFGQTGPWRGYKASDIVGLAVGGVLYVSGWPDVAPVSIAASHAYHHVSLEAAAATLIALYHRNVTGEGQHIDVSMHQSLPLCLMNAVPRYTESGEIMQRLGDEHEIACSGVFPCKDGYVDFRLFWYRSWDPLVQWLDEEGMAEDLKEDKWQDPIYRSQPAAVQHVDAVFRDFLAKHTKGEIYEEGQRRGFTVAPVNTPKDVANDPHLKARHFFVSVEHPDLGSNLQYLGAPFGLSETPWRTEKRAPLIGEHNLEVYEGELGFCRQDLLTLKQSGVI